MSHKLLTGRSEFRLKELPDNSVDSVVTDPPYELGFMGKSWDSTGIAYNVAMWAECLRVLKPGGHLLAFGGSRTYHRLACAVEDAGFEIRDQIMWVYGSGFPKSLDVSKAIDKAAGATREVVGTKIGKGGENLNQLSREGAGDNEDAKGCGAYGLGAKQTNIEIPITAPATDDAKKWDGWGTALKPAHEPIVVARKPFDGTVAANVLTHGTGALNIAACRVGTESVPINKLEAWSGFGQEKRPDYTQTISIGRWPGNLIHDGSDEILEAFGGKESNSTGGGGLRNKGADTKNGIYGTYGERNLPKNVSKGDFGSVARFFYCAKTSQEDRNEGCDSNVHPTVKPTDLMRYLCRLVTPPGGTVLDPFTGSGSTGKSAVLEGFNFIGIEQSEEYVAIAEARIAFALEEVKRGTAQQVLFA